VKVTKALTEDMGDNVTVIQRVAHSVDHNVKATKHVTEQLERSQLQEKLRTWLAAPDPSINHNIACKTQHGGTARWFIGSTFRDGKKNGSLLWVHGNPGAGKSIL
jgi:hypothetical protein